MGKAAEIIPWEEYAHVARSLRADKAWRDLLIWVIGGFTAFRVSDYCDLTWESLLGSDSLRIVEKKTSRLSKAARGVVFSEELKEIIDECANNLNPYRLPHRLVFTRKRGPTPASGHISRAGINVAITAIANRYGVSKHVSSHSLRKTFAFHVYESLGANHESLLIVQEMLGHRNIEITKRYLGITKETIKKVYMGLSIYPPKYDRK